MPVVRRSHALLPVVIISPNLRLKFHCQIMTDIFCLNHEILLNGPPYSQAPSSRDCTPGHPPSPDGRPAVQIPPCLRLAPGRTRSQTAALCRVAQRSKRDPHRSSMLALRAPTSAICPREPRTARDNARLKNLHIGTRPACMTMARVMQNSGGKRQSKGSAKRDVCVISYRKAPICPRVRPLHGQTYKNAISLG
jgi:hypothetical protein